MRIMPLVSAFLIAALTLTSCGHSITGPDMTAGANYSGRNNVYYLDPATEEQGIACTVDSYAVEGIWLGADKMVIMNDGLYHDAVVRVNQANIYTLKGD